MRWVCLAAAVELRFNDANGADEDADEAERARTLAELGLGTNTLRDLGTDTASVAELSQQELLDHGKSDADRCGRRFTESNAWRAKAALDIFPHARKVPRDIFLEYVAPATVLDEPRGGPSAPGGDCVEWWQLPGISELASGLHLPQFTNRDNPAPSREVAEWVAANLQSRLSLHFHGDDTPRFMSAQDIIANADNTQREASCTGMSILFVEALRAVGVPARAAGTPAWNGKEERGNHNWVEAYVCDVDGGLCEWRFFDALEPLQSPCKTWFCTAAKLGAKSGTKVYAARGTTTDLAFPLAWAPAKAPGSGGVYAEDRTAAYVSACGHCPGPHRSAPTGGFLEHAEALGRAAAADLAGAADRVAAAADGIAAELARAGAAAEADVGLGHI